MSKVVAIIQARMGSTRLPGKVLWPIGAKTILQHVVERVDRARGIDQLIVAVPSGENDWPLRKECERLGVECVWGPEDDVLARFVLAARLACARQVVRITADCPCVDPLIIDRAVRIHQDQGADYTSNTIERTYPRGFDVEVFDTRALLFADHQATMAHEREHVTPFFYQHPEIFKLASLTSSDWCGDPAWRLCVDTQEDYEMLCGLWNLCADKRGNFPPARRIAECLKEKPEIAGLNSRVRQKELMPAARLVREAG